MPTMTSEAVAVDMLGRILCEVWAEAEETVEHTQLKDDRTNTNKTNVWYTKSIRTQSNKAPWSSA